MINIGYYHEQSGTHSSLVAEGVYPERIETLESHLLRQCPSTEWYRRNTFAVRAPFTLEWSIERKDNDEIDWFVNTDTSTLAFGRGRITPESCLKFSGDLKVVQIAPQIGHSFVSDTQGVIMMVHSNGKTKCSDVVSGVMDIYKWPDREMSLAYHINKGLNEYKIIKGEPLYWLTFITPDMKPVKLIHQYTRHPFLEKTKTKSELPQLMKVNWLKQFQHFARLRPKKLIMEKE